MNEPAETVVLRPTKVVRGSLDALGVLFIGGALYGVINGRADASAMVLIAGVIAGLVGLHRNMLSVTDEGVVSCGGYRTHRWPKEEIQQLVILKQGIGSRTVGLVLTNGTAVRLAGASFVGGKREAAELQERLTSWLRGRPRT
jgi:hypothetical protein